MNTIYRTGQVSPISVSSPIHLSNFQNLNYLYGPYGWKDENNVTHNYFEYRNGPFSERFPSDTNKLIRPSKYSESDCIGETTENGQTVLVYKNSEAYGYALGCKLIKESGSQVSAGIVFGVVNNNDEIVEYVYDGLVNGFPSAHVKIDTEDIVNMAIQGVQDIMPIDDMILRDELLDEYGIILNDKMPGISVNDVIGLQDVITSEISGLGSIQAAAEQAVTNLLNDSEAMQNVVTNVVGNEFVSKDFLLDTNGNVKSARLNLDEADIPSLQFSKILNVPDFVQSSDIMVGNLLKSELMPADVLKTGALTGYAQTNDLVGLQNTISSNFALKAELPDMTQYTPTAQFMVNGAFDSTLMPSNVLKDDDLNGYATTNSVQDSINNVVNNFNVAFEDSILDYDTAIVGDIMNDNYISSLDRLKNVVMNLNIPEIAIRSSKTNTSLYYYCVVTDVDSDIMSESGLKNSDSDVITKVIHSVRDEMDTNKKYIYLIPNNSYLENYYKYTKIELTEEAFNYSKVTHYTYDESTKTYVQCTSDSVYSPVINYYIRESSKYMAAFDCWWIDNSVSDDDGNVKKLPFIKLINKEDTTPVNGYRWDEIIDVPNSIDAFTQKFATITEGDSVEVDSDEYYYNEVKDGEYNISSGLTETYLKMYSNSFKVEIVSEFHTNNSPDVVTPLLTLDTDGDNIGDLNEAICNIKINGTNASVQTFDGSPDLGYYYELKSDYNANKYNNTAKSLIESTIAWYNANVWDSDNKNYIYLFCYKDAPYETDTNLTTYAYYFRAVAYLGNSVVPLDWRPCVPYVAEARKFSYPTIVDLRGSSTNIGLQTGTTVQFTQDMTTDERVDKFLYQETTSQVSETVNVVVPGTPEVDELYFQDYTLNISGKTYDLSLVETDDDERFDTLDDTEGLSRLDYRSALILNGLYTYVNNNTNENVIAYVLYSMAAAVVRNVSDSYTNYDIINNIYGGSANNEGGEIPIDETFTRIYEKYEAVFKGDSERDGFDNLLQTIAYNGYQHLKGNSTSYPNYVGVFVLQKIFNEYFSQVKVLVDFFSIMLSSIDNIETLLHDELYKLLQSTDLSININDISSLLITSTYVLSKVIDDADTSSKRAEISMVFGHRYVPYVAEHTTQETVTTTVVRKSPRVIGSGFEAKNYEFTNPFTNVTYNGRTTDWFRDNTIVTFYVNKSGGSNGSVSTFEFRKWNRATRTWCDMGVEQYVHNSGSNPSFGGTLKPVYSTDNNNRRIINRVVINQEEAILDVNNAVATDMNNTIQNIALLAEKINSISFTLNSVVGDSRLKPISWKRNIIGNEVQRVGVLEENTDAANYKDSNLETYFTKVRNGGTTVIDNWTALSAAIQGVSVSDTGVPELPTTFEDLTTNMPNANTTERPTRATNVRPDTDMVG